MPPSQCLSKEKKPRRRRAISNAQRRALRTWYVEAETPPSPAESSAWWKQTYGYYLNSRSVSEILGNKYISLDYTNNHVGDATQAMQSRKRHRDAKWADLEAKLMDWVSEYELTVGKDSTSGNMLRQKATELWHSMACYNNTEMPQWSEGWRRRFITRYKLRQHLHMREATALCVSSTPLLPPSVGSCLSESPSSTELALDPSSFGPAPQLAWLTDDSGSGRISDAVPVDLYDNKALIQAWDKSSQLLESIGVNVGSDLWDIFNELWVESNSLVDI